MNFFLSKKHLVRKNSLDSTRASQIELEFRSTVFFLSIDQHPSKPLILLLPITCTTYRFRDWGIVTSPSLSFSQPITNLVWNRCRSALFWELQKEDYLTKISWGRREKQQQTQTTQGSTKNLELRLVLWASSSHIFLVQGHFLVLLDNDFVRRWLVWTIAHGQGALKVT